MVAALAAACATAGHVVSTHLWWVDAGSETLRLVAAAGRFRPESDPVRVGSDCTLGVASASERAVMEREFELSIEGANRDVWRYAVPVQVGDSRGVAAIDIAGAEPDRSALNLTVSFYRAILAGSLATYAAQLQSRAARDLLGAARVLTGISDSRRLVDALLVHATDLARADTGSVMLLDSHRMLSIAAAKGLPSDVVASTRVGDGEGIAGWVLATQKPVLVEDLVDQPRGKRHGVRTALSVPISDDQGILGVLNVGAREFRAWPQPSVADALEGLGRTAAVCLRAARGAESQRLDFFDTLRSVARAVEANNPQGPASAERLLEVVTDLGNACGLHESDVEALRVAALIHDVGMAGVGTCAPHWERPLSTVEWGMVKVHPVIAAHALAQVVEARDAVPIVLHHHERFDGHGYVDGLAGEDIPVAARVFAVADAFVAMTSPRPYRLALTVAQAVDELRDKSGAQFDPSVVDIFVDTAGKHDGWVNVWG